MSDHTYEELAALHAIAKILAQPWDLRDQLEHVFSEMSARLGMQRGMISLLDRDTGEAWLEVAHGINLEGVEVTYQSGEGITGRVAQTGRPMAIPSLGREALFLDRTGARRNVNRDELAFLCVPIVYDARVVGILSADKVARDVENLDRELAMLSSVAELIAKAVHILALEEENRRLRRIVNEGKSPSADIIGHSKGMEDVFGLIRHVADSTTTVLILGETGTGKELVAQAVHANSGRSKGPLIKVNCAAIPDTLIESELFGHEKGAFTGALRQRRGRFEEAMNGSIFLDEVSELSAAAQAKLLRVLQEKQFQPLGSSRFVTTNARIIAATNRRLEDCVTAGQFRTDLYYRVSVFPIYLPPLRERGNDIILLADHFVLKYARRLKKPVRRISSAVIEAFLSHPWPGNVRELENCIERAILLAKDDSIEMIHLPPSLQTTSQGDNEKEAGRLNAVIGAQERSMIIDALKETRGNQSQAARLLGTTKRIIQYKIHKLGIDPWKFRPG
ncbi:MAG TPA: sigma 54-interacting transcriptional regulator [Syntrophales bacterium]|nr:sigma 54-interacting transcriptional regulator [Syntrophales bacterium]HOX95230.1 sigma 54-interacting transcriptional regulator [Syntrophales bacterium]HPI55762.1 sigma 54-interacting transcriptional regulator [Syntrophales bacterium]HPN23746.1 sigma 54-interacting transcriptional regulator [Syntrophales bacterium]HQM27728.1 sigma 54-interacting transcriptional regulator [Syntrophales bacterium]